MSKKTYLMIEDEKYQRMVQKNSTKDRKRSAFELSPRVLIISDIAGWAIENMANNIVRVLKDEFDFTMIVAEDMPEYEKFFKEQLNEYEIIYPLLPGYIPESVYDFDNILSTFHGGPGVEGQADQIDRNLMNNMNISFVSNQVRERVTETEFKSNRRIRVPLKYVFDEKAMLREQRLDNDSVRKYRIDTAYDFYREPSTNERAGGNVHLWRKGFGLKNLYFTPHGINPAEYKRTQEVSQKELICGYAGWLKYITGGQKAHRRTDWILQAQRDLDFRLELAGGLKQYVDIDIKLYKKSLELNHMHKIDINCYEKSEMSDFYSKINCYLVPDKFAGGPMPVLEAGLLEVPPVTTNCGLCGDIITHMENGYIVNTRNEFYEGIKFMRDNPDERVRMGKNLRKYILKNRTWEKVKGHWRDFFNSV